MLECKFKGKLTFENHSKEIFSQRGECFWRLGQNSKYGLNGNQLPIELNFNVSAYLLFLQVSLPVHCGHLMEQPHMTFSANEICVSNMYIYIYTHTHTYRDIHKPILSNLDSQGRGRQEMQVCTI